MLDLLGRFIDYFRDSRKARKAGQTAALEGLAELHGNVEAVLTEFFLARENDSNEGFSPQTMAHFAVLSRLDGSIQRLHLQIRSAFREEQVLDAVAELFRRYSLAKQFVTFSHAGYRRQGFALALGWLNWQARHAISLAAGSTGLDLSDPRHPFLVGFSAIGMLDENPIHRSDEQPWEQLQREWADKEAKMLWEEAGHVSRNEKSEDS